MKFILALAAIFLSLSSQAGVSSVGPSFGKLGLPKQVLGTYPRDRVMDTSEFPFRIIGQIELGCTGTLIGPKHVLTAAHCVYDAEADEWYDNLDFYPGRISADEFPFGTAKWKKVYIQQEYTAAGDNQYDFAVIELEEAIGENLGWSGFRVLPETEYNNQVRITGYPGDKDKGTMWTVSCPSSVQGTMINYLCDTYGGMSGSAVYSLLKDPSKTYVTSVHTFGSTDANGGVILDQKNFSTILSWRNQTDIPSNTLVHEKVEKPKQDYDKLFIQNSCHLPIRVYLGWKNLDGNWEGDGPWTLVPGERAYVADTRNRIYYFGGLSNRAEYVWKGDHPVQLKNGNEFLLIQGTITTDSWGEWTQNFVCE